MISLSLVVSGGVLIYDLSVKVKELCTPKKRKSKKRALPDPDVNLCTLGRAASDPQRTAVRG